MKKTNIYKYYRFGYNYYVLRFVEKGKIYKEVVGHVKEFLSFLDELSLLTTKQAARDLEEILGELKAQPQEDVISGILCEQLTVAIDNLDRTLDSELQLKEAYILTERRFELKKLLYGVNELLAKDVFSKLPLIVQYDLKEAGKCIVFNLPTAAAFHVLRATEGALRDYYHSIVKRNKLKNPMWGDMIAVLKDHRK